MDEDSFSGLLLSETPIQGEILPPHWSEKFKYDLYDWDDPEWNRENRRRGKYRYVPVMLTKGYFMFVLAKHLKRMTFHEDGSPKRWHVKVGTKPNGKDYRIKAVYAARRGRKGEPKDVFAHREVTGSLTRPHPVDHINGWQLDNRWLSFEDPVNLRCKPRINGVNSIRPREKNPGLPVGVEFRNGKYGGIYCRRTGKKGPDGRRPVKTVRSKRKWLTPEPAARWYQNQMKKLYPNHGGLVSDPSSVSFPEFPPRLDEEMSAESLKLREKLARSKSVRLGNRPPAHEDIPF